MTIWASNKNSYSTLNESFELLKLTLFMHRPFSHVNMSSPHGCGVAQWCSVTFSSAPSTQSGSPSHILREITANRQHIISIVDKKNSEYLPFLWNTLWSSPGFVLITREFGFVVTFPVVYGNKDIVSMQEISIWTTIRFNECKEILTALMSVIFIAVVQTI